METLREWFRENCRPSGQNTFVCQRGKEVYAIEPFDEQEAGSTANEENIERFLNRHGRREL